jgi:leader peptidase (prepilin peptidase)/N-methyltransferase
MPGDVIIHDSYLSVAGAQLPWLLVAWLGVLGAVIGSFLNVVVYRLPRGMSLSVPGSHCPQCQHAIRWYDNLPVLGWLKLGGKCRDCKAAISPRYPLVEALVACIFIATAIVDLPASSELESTIETAAWGAFAVHAFLLTTLLAAALIKYDSQPLPIKLFAPAILIALCVAIAWPGVFRFPLAWYPGDRFAFVEGPPLGWPESLGGLVAGLVVGSVLTVLARSGSAGSLFGNLSFELATLGCCLGWQATVLASVCVLTGLWLAAWNLRAAVGAVFVAGLIWIVSAPSLLESPQPAAEPVQASILAPLRF